MATPIGHESNKNSHAYVRMCEAASTHRHDRTTAGSLTRR
jgi:hypothetical protein